MTKVEKEQFLSSLKEHYNKDVLTKRQITDFAKKSNFSNPEFIFCKKYEAGFGKYYISTEENKLSTVSPINDSVLIENPLDDNSFVPKKDPLYVPFGFYNKLSMIVKSKIFYPVYITGLSGNGKTMMVEQLCATLKREFIRVNITKDTDETDLIGNYELINGNTIRKEGAVLTAMRRGAILLLDETDLGTERLLCLQPILEGKPYFDKKTGEIIEPAIGFNIIATANTKGKGSDDGRFIGTNVLNEAFLERFAITVEQEYPCISVEKKILTALCENLHVADNEFIDDLTNWSDNIRKTYFDGGHDEIISTRRLTHIIKAYAIFKDRLEAVELCLNRFDELTKKSFLDLYTKISSETKNNDIYAKYDISDESELADLSKKFNITNPIAAPPSAPQTNTSVATSNPKDEWESIEPSKLPKFATNKILFEISVKYNEKIIIKYSSSKKSYLISSHGKDTQISEKSLNSYQEKVEGDILNLLVQANLAKKNGNVADTYRPII